MRVCASARMSALYAWAHMYMHAYVHACVCSRTCVGTGMYMQACVCVCVHHLCPYPQLSCVQLSSKRHQASKDRLTQWNARHTGESFSQGVASR